MVDLVLLHLPSCMDPARYYYIAVGRCADKDSWPWFQWDSAGIPGGKLGIQTGDGWCHSCSACLLLPFLLCHICDFHQGYKLPEKINQHILRHLQLSHAPCVTWCHVLSTGQVFATVREDCKQPTIETVLFCIFLL